MRTSGSMKQTEPMSENTHSDPSALTLREATQCASRIIRFGTGAASVETVSQLLSEYLYDHFRVPATGAPALLLSRVFVTRPLDTLEPHLKIMAEGMAGAYELSRQARCCVLMGSCGQFHFWCHPRLSTRFGCVPLESPGFNTRMPMFSYLLDQLEIGSLSAQQHDAAFLLSDLDRAFNVFHIEEALGHPFIPAQAEFVQQYGVKSVIGFGGRLPSGEAFAAVLFSAVHIPPAAANHFRVIALSVYLTFLNSDLAFIEEHLRDGESLKGNGRNDLSSRLVLEAQRRGHERILDLYDRLGREQAEHIERTTQELRALTSRLFTSEDSYRRQLSLDLHDELSSKIGSIMFNMGSLLAAPPQDQHQLLDSIGRFREELDVLSTWSRSKAHELHPAVLTNLGLVAAVKRLAAEYANRLKCPVEVRVAGESVPEMCPLVSTTIYRVIQEALRNVEKHAKASRVAVALFMEADGLRVRIEDNGVGFDREKVRKEVAGIGLIGIEERIRLVSGALSIGECCGTGTRIDVMVPHKRKAWE
ncbi:MAG: hypothetical protein P0119_13985 [Nitrospira sp.]|nr:hypothetical protein [Nitrospira sp.]